MLMLAALSQDPSQKELLEFVLPSQDRSAYISWPA